MLSKKAHILFFLSQHNVKNVSYVYDLGNHC